MRKLLTTFLVLSFSLLAVLQLNSPRPVNAQSTSTTYIVAGNVYVNGQGVSTSQDINGTWQGFFEFVKPGAKNLTISQWYVTPEASSPVTMTVAVFWEPQCPTGGNPESVKSAASTDGRFTQSTFTFGNYTTPPSGASTSTTAGGTVPTLWGFNLAAPSNGNPGFGEIQYDLPTPISAPGGSPGCFVMWYYIPNGVALPSEIHLVNTIVATEN